MSEETWEPRVGEYYRIKPNIGRRAKFGKILAILHEDSEESLMVACVEDEPSYPYGFMVKVNIMNRVELLPITVDDPLITQSSSKSPQRIREAIKQYYRDRALSSFSKKLNDAIEDI